MSVLFIILPLAIVMASLAVGVFIFAVRGGQYDDLDAPAWRVLFDENGKPKTKP